MADSNEPIKKEIYEGERAKAIREQFASANGYDPQGDAMGQENPWKGRVAKPKDDKAGPDNFKKGAIQRRIAKMNTKGKTVEAKDAK